MGPTPLARAAIRGIIERGRARYWPRALIGGPAAMRQPLRQCDTVVHLAYLHPCATGLWARLEQEIVDNFAPTIRLLEAAADAGVQHACFSSSIAVYKPGMRPSREPDFAGDPRTPHALVKLAQEWSFRQWAQPPLRRATILRLATVYGPGETVRRPIPTFIRAALSGTALVLDGKGAQPLDAIFVGDVVEAFVAALDRGLDGTFNIGTGVTRSVREVAELIAALCGARAPIVEDESAIEPGGVIADVSAAKAALGFMARTPLDAGIQQEIEWFAATPFAAAS